MHLQRLEIAGFKSFPERAALSFEQGVTAIVGPNGCGKSNVVDAITWVLGEQSARILRGDRMEDVIFGGSDGRRPTGAAEVRLILKSVGLPGHGNGHGNGNGHTREGGPGSAPDLAELHQEPRPLVRDVEVARRLYRSGESEYLIDGHVCRLRDVQDLLINAGLGVRGYAVIEQGKIGQILSARPADRRQLIEEAAGVTKYKSRRRTAELKLEAAQQNLLRVDDIIFEIEKQRGALRRQAAKARRYQRLRDELRRWEKVLFARRSRMLLQAKNAATARLTAARDREAAAAVAVSELDAWLGAARLELAEAEACATRVREGAHATELTAGRLQQQIEFDRRQVQTLADQTDTVARELAQLQARRGPDLARLEERRAASVRAHEDRGEAERVLVEAEAMRSAAEQQIQGLEGDVEAARSEVFAAVSAATALGHVADHARAGRARLSEELARLEVEASDLRMEIRQFDMRRELAVASLEGAGVRLEATRRERAEQQARLAAARADRDGHAAELRRRDLEVAALAGRLASLEELEASRAAYGEAARLVLAERPSSVGPLGSVADFLEVDRGFERPVEACLGPLLQHVLVPDSVSAAAGLEFARSRAIGRCGFVVLGAVKTKTFEVSKAGPSGPSGSLRSLHSVVTITGEHEAVLDPLLRDAWIASSFDEAAAAATETGGVVATLAGDVFRGPRIVTGGSPDDARGILAAKREVRDLRERLAAEQKALEVDRDRLNALVAEVEAVERAVADLEARCHQQEKELVGYELEQARAGDEGERLERKQALVEAERRRADEERRALEGREEEARISIERLDSEQRAADERFTVAQRALFDARESLGALGRRAAEAQATHAALVERAGALLADVRRLEDAAVELDGRVASTEIEIERAFVRRRELEAGLTAADRDLAAALEKLDGLRRDARHADDRVSELHASVQVREAGIREARRALDQTRTDTGEFEVAYATAEADHAHLAASCLETLQQSLEEVAEEVHGLEEEGLPRPAVFDASIEEDADAAEEPAGAEERRVDLDRPAEDVIADLRAKIDRLGPVNMMAIEQFDELETRHAFLTTQRADLVSSITATNDAIKRIDRTTRERFREAFDAIQGHFQQTFSTLFGGGRAGLVLIDETDLLESGIDIIAEPPGKRLQSVQLLSGGEKALTAIALMFAIFKYRPSPFCLLDEIDAPLDDANIGRFVEMLRAMQDHTQFVLITHNRRTMEIADRLYGVTMEEPGVSKLVSVQLN
jgi:chromosome segregation protein